MSIIFHKLVFYLELFFQYRNYGTFGKRIGYDPKVDIKVGGLEYLMHFPVNATIHIVVQLLAW